MYETIFTNTKDYGDTFLKEFNSKLSSANQLMIASGYVGATTIEDLESRIVTLSRKGSCKILLGMIFHGGVTAKQKEVLISLDEKLRAIAPNNGVYISMKQYHGKIYRFETEESSCLYLGSSNFSKEGFATRLECTTLIKDEQTKIDVTSYLEHLFSLSTTVPLSKTDLRVNGKKKIIIKASKELKDYKILEAEYPNIAHALGTCKVKLRVDVQPRSSLNLYFEKGRLSKGKYAPRPWYEVELTATTTEISSEFYPPSKLIEAGKKSRQGAFDMYFQEEDDYYKVQMVVHADNGKNISSAEASGGRSTLGKIIKGRLERAGLLSEGDLITSDILEAYGNDSISLIKISDEDYILEF